MISDIHHSSLITLHLILIQHRQFGQGRFYVFLRIGVVFQLAAEVFVVGGHIAQAVAAEIKDDALGLAGFAAFDGFDYRAADGMRSFRGGNNAFGLGEQLGRLETFVLMVCRGFDNAQRRAEADHWGHAVVAQSAGMDARRHETMSQGEHLD
jgi:hypothetical protein